MKNHTIYCLLLIAALQISCSENNAGKGWEPDLLTESVDSLGYSLLVDSIEYVSLQTTDSCLIGEITDLAMSDDRIFIFDKRTQTIWIFSRSGEYLNKIFKKGSGEGEYTHINQFEYDKKNDRIVVSSWGHRLIFYSTTGEYQKTVELRFTPQDFKISPQGGFILSQAGLDTPEAGIYSVNDEGKDEKFLVKRKNNHLVSMNWDWELCSYGNIICFMAPCFDNEVYHYDNHQLEMKYPFRMKPALKHDYPETVSLQFFEDFVRTGYLEGPKWIWATYWSSVHDLRVFIYSKENKKYWIGKSLVNDMDGKENAAKTSATDDNTFVFWIENEDSDENPIIQILYLK